MVKGISVSEEDPATVNPESLSFVFIQTTQGMSHESTKWRKQAASGKRHDLVLGKYHCPDIYGSPEREAHGFLRKSDVREGDLLILYWDWTDSAPNSTAVRYKRRWLQTVKSAHQDHKVLVYCHRNRWLYVDTDQYCQDGLWIADWNSQPGQPRIAQNWIFHEHTRGSKSTNDHAKADSTVGMFQSAHELKKWAGLEVEEQTQSQT